MEVNKCSGCKAILQGKKFINCPGCKQKYDLQCANLSPKRFRVMDDESKRLWRCPECKSNQPKADNTNTPVRNIPHPAPVSDDQGTDADHSTVTLRRKPDGSTNFITENTLRGLFKAERQEMANIIQAAVSGISDQLNSIKSQCVGFQESLSFVSGQNEELKQEISELKKILGVKSAEIKSIKEENKKLKDDLNVCINRVRLLEENNLKQQQWVRMQNLEFVGIPETKEEIPIEKILKISKFIGVSIQASDIEFAHRVQPRHASSATRGRPIVVNLKQRAVKDQIFAAARKFRNLSAMDLDLGGEECKIFVNEHLTRENKMLLSSCKTKAKEANYKYIWTKNCRIFVRRNDSSPPIPITSTSDLSKIA